LTIHIKELSFEAIIGILEHERQTPQRVVLNIDMEYEYQEGRFINYATVAQELTQLIITGGYELLEEAIIAIEKHLTQQYQTLLKTLRIEIQKPDILDNCVVSLSQHKKF